MSEKKKKDDDRQGMLIGGVIVLGVGAIFLFDSLGIIPMFKAWPLFMIVVGVALIAGSFIKRKKPEDSE